MKQLPNGSQELSHCYEVAIIGAGPIGIEVAVCLKRANVDLIHFDAHQIRSHDDLVAAQYALLQHD